jgi:hypothetical protein
MRIIRVDFLDGAPTLEVIYDSVCQHSRSSYHRLTGHLAGDTFDPWADSGVMFYVQESPKYKQTYDTGLEMQIADLSCTVPDSREILRRSGDLYGLISTKVNTVKNEGEWNQFEIVADHGNVQLIQNGQAISTRLGDDAWRQLVAHSKFAKWPDFGTFRNGHISLQGTEKKGDSEIKIYFRNIKIK